MSKLKIDLYDNESGEAKFFGLHFNGTQHAAFANANAALAWQRGQDTDYFHITDAEGNKVTMHDQPRHPGHAYAIMAALKKADE